MKVGDLVFDLPFGKAWFKNNPWLSGSEIGVVTEIVNHATVFVLWSTGQVSMMDIDHLEKVCESR